MKILDKRFKVEFFIHYIVNTYEVASFSVGADSGDDKGGVLGPEVKVNTG